MLDLFSTHLCLNILTYNNIPKIERPTMYDSEDVFIDQMSQISERI